MIKTGDAVRGMAGKIPARSPMKWERRGGILPTLRTVIRVIHLICMIPSATIIVHQKNQTNHSSGRRVGNMPPRGWQFRMAFIGMLPTIPDVTKHGILPTLRTIAKTM
jgi:hypothetical protein